MRSTRRGCLAVCRLQLYADEGVHLFDMKDMSCILVCEDELLQPCDQLKQEALTVMKTVHMCLFRSTVRFGRLMAINVKAMPD